MYVRFQGWRPPRNPLLRLLLAIAGVALLGFFTVFGLMVAAAVMAVLGLRALWRQLAAPARRPVDPQPSARVPHAPPPPGVIEGEYRVIHRS
jgi:hypothetical protein